MTVESMIKRILGIRDEGQDNIISLVSNELAAIDTAEGLFENVVKWAGFYNCSVEGKATTNN